MAYKRSRQTFEADLQRQESPYVFYGTPLPPLDGEVRDDGSFVPIWKQEVTDDRGRKRLHGAFTGGFSAGYFNSVGSKEGWAPSTFVSSRQNRAKGDSKTSRQMRPEDFMDEEDLQEAEEARQLQTSHTFTGFGTEHDQKRRDALIDLFRPAGETVGVRLLKRMGWQEGQGIGTTIKPGAGTVPGVSNTYPLNESNISFKPKSDRKGLGYDGDQAGALVAGEASTNISAHRIRMEDVDPEPVARNSSHGTAKEKTKKAAFGVGVLNDTGSDDEDPYSMGPQISYNRVIGGEKKQKKGGTVGTANPSVKVKPVFLSKKLANLQGALRKCHDGRLPLEGFVLGDSLDAMGSLSLENDKYRPPDVPVDWKSSLAPAEDQQEAQDFQSVAEAAKLSSHTSKTRALLLGESQLPGKSIFDYLSPAARDRLVQASGKANLPQALGEKPPEGFPRSGEAPKIDLQGLVPQLNQDVALEALKRGKSEWMPYGEDEGKRERYQTYLEIRAGLRATSEGTALPPRAEGVSQEDWVLEMQEFARAAQVFKPVTGLMASRFTSSTSPLPASDNPDSSVATESLISGPKAKPEDPAEAAARMGMFGHMTRSFANFYPTRLVCKRFNVPMPDHANLPPQSEAPRFTPDMTAKIGASRFQSAGYQGDEKTEPIPRPSGDPASGGKGSNMASGQKNNGYLPASEAFIDPERNEALEREKPSQAVFKAIFDSDDKNDDI